MAFAQPSRLSRTGVSRRCQGAGQRRCRRAASSIRVKLSRRFRLAVRVRCYSHDWTDGRRRRADLVLSSSLGLGDDGGDLRLNVAAVVRASRP